MKKLILCSLIGVLLMVGCNKPEEDEVLENSSSLTLLSKETTATDLTVELYINTSKIEVGYQPLFVKVKDSEGKVKKNATVLFEPEMDMGTMAHGCPVVQPNYTASSQLYEGVAIFTMASGSMGTWSMGITVDGEKVEFPIEVSASKTGTKYVGSYTGLDGENYILSIVKPMNWKVGMNDFSIVIHQSSMHHFEEVDGLNIEFDPEMTSMEHGSPNNTHPTSQGAGVYSGKVNLTMTGDWRLNFDLYQGDELIVEGAYIDILF